jgi:hypothetical protein
VVDAVAHHVHQRIVDVLDHLAIELRVLARENQIDLLARMFREVATSRAIFWKVWRIGTMRIAMALRCRSLVMRRSCARLRVRRSSTACSADRRG